MTVPVFVDTNIAAYAFGEDEAKRARARSLLANHPTISTQVVNEFLNVCRVKLKIDVATRHRLTQELMAGCDEVTVNPRQICSNDKSLIYRHSGGCQPESSSFNKPWLTV